MTAAQWIAILAIGLPALVIVLWPLARGRGRLAGASPRFDDRLELEEEKASIYQALTDEAARQRLESLLEEPS